MGDEPDAPLFPPVVKADPRAEQYKRELASAAKTIDLVKFYLAAGSDPKYVAHRFGVSVERCERYAAALKAREKQKR